MDEKENVILRQLPQARRLPWENMDLQLLWEERHLTKFPSFPEQLFQPSCLEEGTWKPHQSSLGDNPLPKFHFFMDNFF
jgi:hypothetical protein